MSLPGSTQIIVRGATIQFVTTFFDVNNVVTQPDNATINIQPTLPTGASPVTITMTPPTLPAVTWTALWDTRGITAPQTIYWSIHTGHSDPISVTAEDGYFNLSANPANLVTF
jgi:hypothetical protein